MFVVFEGGEGSSKTTQVKLLSKYLNTNGVKHIITKEPGSPFISSCKKIRELILDPESNLCNKAELFLYLADRAEHIDKCILPALKEGKWVISDRFIDSTLVYQVIGRNLKNIKNIVNYASDQIQPDLTFIMDVPIEIGLSRAKKSNVEFAGGDRMERQSLDFHKSVRQGFLEIGRTSRNHVIIDASNSIEEIHRDVIKNLSRYKEYLQNE